MQHDVTLEMSLKDLQLEQINLTSGPDKIKLRVDTMLQLGVPKEIAQSTSEEILLSLTSGKLWATRGASCSLDFYIDPEDPELDAGIGNQIVESLGHRIRDAHLWSQLFLSTSLDTPQRDDSTKFSFSVRLGHRKPPLSSVLPPEDWLAGNIDVQPPDGVRRATVEGVQIRLKVQPISIKPRRPPKKRKPADTVGDSMILDSSLETFKGIVTSLSETLPLAVTKGFGLCGSEDPQLDSLLLDEPLLWNHQRLGFRDDFGASEDMLPVPTEVLFSPPTEDDMLLSESADSVPPLLSQISTLSTLSFQSSVSLKRSEPPNSPVITARPVHRLVEVAVHTLLEGHHFRRPKGFQTIVTEPATPTSSLSKLCPAIFNLGFKEGMASNNQFLTTITRTISFSWPRYVQSPSLRRKLAQLGNRGEDNDHSSDRKDVDTTLLSGVVSGRLWAMMQKKLHISSRKLAWDLSIDKEDMVHEDSLDNSPADPDILGEGYEKLHNFEDLLADDFEEKDFEEAFLEFEDLFADDGTSDDGLLDCLAETERERIQIENNTDDMLFGYAGNYNREEFPDDGQGDDSMMLLEDTEEGTNDKCMLF